VGNIRSCYNKLHLQCVSTHAEEVRVDAKKRGEQKRNALQMEEELGNKGNASHSSKDIFHKTVLKRRLTGESLDMDGNITS